MSILQYGINGKIPPYDLHRLVQISGKPQSKMGTSNHKTTAKITHSFLKAPPLLFQIP